jgi:creatinine amidohydrolase
MGKTNIARMVWPEVAEAVARNAVVMVPLASIEPSGRHSVMGGEIFIADYFADGVAARTGSVRVPTMPFGYAPTFLGFPGAISLEPATLAGVLGDTCRSLLRHGFDHILVVDNHSGNEAIVEQTARQLKAETGVVLGNILLPPVMQAVAKDLYPDLAAVQGHGGEPGVSARLFLCPEDMRLDLADAGATVSYHGLKASGTTVQNPPSRWTLYLDFGDTNPSGGTGDARGANADRGRTIMERMVDYGVGVVDVFRKVPTRHRGVKGGRE